MILRISLDVNDIKLTLKDGRKIVGELAWTDEYTLSEKLLPNIDALLKQAKVKKEEVEKVTTKITKNSGVTSARIVRTVAAAWKIAAGAASQKSIKS
jgi:hypothetical protein